MCVYMCVCVCVCVCVLMCAELVSVYCSKKEVDKFVVGCN